jgi:tetratricopeptide (TPR) repeat protein
MGIFPFPLSPFPFSPFHLMLSWFQVPEDIKQLLILAADNWQNTSISEEYLNQALAKTDDSIDVLVAAYRYFYYKNNYQMALQVAIKVINKVKNTENIPDDWEQCKPILLNRQEDENIRLYLTAYAAYSLVLAKLGEFEQAKVICMQIKEVDIKNEFKSASLLLDILTHPPTEDD